VPWAPAGKPLVEEEVSPAPALPQVDQVVSS